MNDHDIDPLETFAAGFDELPDDRWPLMPEVWTLAECTEAKAITNTKISPAVPQIQVRWKVLESAAATEASVYGADVAVAAGTTARGTVTDWLSMPPKDHPAMNANAINFQRAHFRKALVAALAPHATEKAAQDAQVADATRAAGGYPQALVGKQALVKFGVNEGKDKTGAVVNETRFQEPRNQVADYKPATDANIAKFVRGEGTGAN